MTAAAADRTSFGCAPNNKNTWFIESLNTAMAQEGSWKIIFEGTKSIVRSKEKAQGIPADKYSNPQSYVGSKMRGVWSNSI